MNPLLSIRFLRVAAGLCGFAMSDSLLNAAGGEAPLFSFGAIADCQYCDGESTPTRKYRLSPGKLEACVADFNRQELSHVVHLGDFIDREWESFDVVLPIMNRSKALVRHVLGNHDFSVEDSLKEKVPARLGLKARYYDFAVGKWRFLVLDTNDVSLYAHPSQSAETQAAQAYFDAHGGKLAKWNGAIGKAQLQWVETQLQRAQQRGESVVVHSHHPVYPFSNHAAWNAVEIVELIERYDCVAAYLNGHNHSGSYGLRKGIHYVTLRGMVDTEETSYSVVSVFPDRLEIKGVGRQNDFVLGVGRRGVK